MCPTNNLGIRNKLEINGAATLCFNVKESTVKGSLESEDGTQYDIYGTFSSECQESNSLGKFQ